MLNKDSIFALINLLDDSDEEIIAHVTTKILSFGEEIIPLLETAWENQELSYIHQEKIEQITHEIQLNVIKSELSSWKKSKDFNLIDAWMSISKWQFPGITLEN